ncbi:MAG: hypothetical protein ABI600_06055 [Luteolibacter sp.]
MELCGKVGTRGGTNLIARSLKFLAPTVALRYAAEASISRYLREECRLRPLGGIRRGRREHIAPSQYGRDGIVAGASRSRPLLEHLAPRFLFEKQLNSVPFETGLYGPVFIFPPPGPTHPSSVISARTAHPHLPIQNPPDIHTRLGKILANSRIRDASSSNRMTLDITS